MNNQDQVNNANSAIIFDESLISQDCQSGSIGQSSPGGPGIKVVSFHDMHSEISFAVVCFCLVFVVGHCLSLVVVCRLLLFVVCHCLLFVIFVCQLLFVICRLSFVVCLFVVFRCWSFVVCRCLVFVVVVCRLLFVFVSVFEFLSEFG